MLTDGSDTVDLTVRPNHRKLNEFREKSVSKLRVETRIVSLQGIDARASGLVLISSKCKRGPVFVSHVVAHGLAYIDGRIHVTDQITRVDSEKVTESTAGSWLGLFSLSFSASGLQSKM